MKYEIMVYMTEGNRTITNTETAATLDAARRIASQHNTTHPARDGRPRWTEQATIFSRVNGKYTAIEHHRHGDIFTA